MQVCLCTDTDHNWHNLLSNGSGVRFWACLCQHAGPRCISGRLYAVVLEYFIRFHDGLPGAYYVVSQFQREDPDATHLNQFYHVECELLGDMNVAISIAEGYIAHLTRVMLKQHSSIILNTAGTLSHAQELLKNLEKPLPRVTLDQSHSHYAFLWLPWMGSGGTTAVWQEANSKGRKSSNWKVWRCCLADRNGPSWCALLPSICWRLGQEQSQGSWPSHRVRGDSRAWGTSFYTWNGTRGLTAPCCTRGLLQMVHQHAPSHPSSYKRMGMGTERYLCWLLQQNDVRDMQIIPRLKAKKFLP